MSASIRVPCVCRTCGKQFSEQPNRIRAGRGKYCSKPCHYKAHGRRPQNNGDGTVTIPLTRGESTVIDEADLPLVANRSWSLKGGHVPYAVANIRGRIVKLHQLLIDIPEGMVCDHIDGDSLNNRRSNLRVCTHQENNFNSKIRKGRRFKGVTMLPSGRYHVRVAGESIGTFDTEEEAAGAYNAAASDMFGEFARLNPVSRRNI